MRVLNECRYARWKMQIYVVNYVQSRFREKYGKRIFHGILATTLYRISRPAVFIPFVILSISFWFLSFSFSYNLSCLESFSARPRSKLWFTFIREQTRCISPRNVEGLVTCLIRRYTSRVTSISTHRVFLMIFDRRYRLLRSSQWHVLSFVKDRGISFISKIMPSTDSIFTAGLPVCFADNFTRSSLVETLKNPSIFDESMNYV